MEIVFWLIAVGTLVVCARFFLTELRISQEVHRQQVIRRKLKAFEYSERVRKAAAAKQATYELNALAQRTAQAMLRAAIEANGKPAKNPTQKRRCK